MVMLVYWRVQHETASIVRLVCLQNGELQSRLHYHYKYAEYASQKHIRSVLPFMLNHPLLPFMLNHPKYFYIRKTSSPGQPNSSSQNEC